MIIYLQKKEEPGLTSSHLVSTMTLTVGQFNLNVNLTILINFTEQESRMRMKSNLLCDTKQDSTVTAG